DEKMERCVKTIVPEFGRCVVFSTTGESFHGHPAPVAHPEGKPRRSIALYYYTATWTADSRAWTTQFKARKGSPDQSDWRVRRDELLTEYLPPALSRPVIRTLRRRRKAAAKSDAQG
ncbi:MAG TPA: proline hydroxylase, partial [Parvularcula sp.]|nr:proline hydroxylase [Parvularcula sp.]